MVYYRKYRPQTIAELDNQKVRETLYAVLSSVSVPHAFLFTGPKGLGKTSAARIVAKAVNCQQKAKRKKQNEVIEPCNKCDQCISITNGTNLDVLEIDGASNRGIDEIRDLREKIRLSPASAKKKVYIIDEVHMLTTEAFNALLKTLEEPPPHALFILCTTEPQKVPATIVSRCFHIVFTRATNEELVHSLKRILQGEALKAEDEALEIIAKLSDGSFRDGAKILEELVSHSTGSGQGGKKITKELIEQKFQISNIQFQISNMLEFLAKKDAKGGLRLIGKMVEQGVDMKYFIEQLINTLHELLLFQFKIIPSPGTTSALTVEEIRKLVELLAKAHQELKYAVLPQLPLELVIVEWSVGDAVALRSPRQFENSSNASAPAVRQSADLGVRPAKRDLAKSYSHAKAPRATEMDRIWQQLIEKVKQHNHSVAGVLRGCTLSRYDGKELVIETKYKFHKEKLEEKKTREILEKACEEIVGKTLKISVVLKQT